MLAGETTRLLALGTVYALLCAPKTRRAADRAAAVAPLRVLHVFGSMERGGAETRTLEMMRRLDRRRYVFDFCVLSGVPGSYAAEIARLGGRVAPCPLRPGRVSFTPRFVRLVRAGRYDVVHSHVHHFSGVVLLLARFAGVRTRIAHLRTAHEQQGSGPLRGAYRSLGRRLLTWHATSVIGVSAAALESFFGEHWERDQRRRLIYNGIEGTRFAGHRDRARVRAELGIRSHAPVIAHVGNFTPAKNHDGLVRIAAAVVARRPDAVFLLVGSGERRSVIEDQVARGGLQRAFRFVGARDDVPRLLAAADAFAFPSLWEGLPGAVLEALASGLPVVASPIPGVLEIARHTSELSTFDRAADAPRARIVAVDPTDASAFAATLVELCTAEARPPAGVATLPRPFTIEESMERLLQCYR
jgi:glycosyltransferase involved in cell wall biosynthesis